MPPSLSPGLSYSEHSSSGDNAPVLLAGKSRDGTGGEAGLLDGAALASHVLGRHRCGCVKHYITVSRYTRVFWSRNFMPCDLM